MAETLGPTPADAVPATLKRDEGRKRERNFDVLTTHIPDFLLLADHGTDPDISRSATRQLIDLGISHGERKDAIDTLEQLQAGSQKALVDLAKENPGLRGARDLLAGLETQINPQSVDIFDEAMLDQDLGEKRPEIVHKTDEISVTLNPDEKDVKALLKSMRRVLRNKGYSIEEIDAILKVNHSFRVDKEELARRMESGEVTLTPGAWTRDIDTWKVVPRKVKSRRELDRDQEEAIAKSKNNS